MYSAERNRIQLKPNAFWKSNILKREAGDGYSAFVEAIQLTFFLSWSLFNFSVCFLKETLILLRKRELEKHKYIDVNPQLEPLSPNGYSEDCIGA